MTQVEALERRYRRLLAWYPMTFRHEYGQEMIAVLLDGAGQTQRRPGIVESADLIWGGTSMRLFRRAVSRPSGAVLAAVRLMYIGAALEVVTLITLVATLGSIRSYAFQNYAGLTDAQWQSVVMSHIVPVAVGTPIAIGVWLVLGWANARGHAWGRLGFAIFFGLTTVSLIVDIAQGAAVSASADVVAGGLLWLVALGALVLVFSKRSRSHYASRTVGAS